MRSWLPTAYVFGDPAGIDVMRLTAAVESQTPVQRSVKIVFAPRAVANTALASNIFLKLVEAYPKIVISRALYAPAGALESTTGNGSVVLAPAPSWADAVLAPPLSFSQ